MAGAQREHGGAMNRVRTTPAHTAGRSRLIAPGQDRREPSHGGFGKNIHVFDDPGRGQSAATGQLPVVTSLARGSALRCTLRVASHTAWTPVLTAHVAVRAAPKTPTSVSARRSEHGPVPGPWATGCRPRSPHGWVHGVPETGPSSERRARVLASFSSAPARPAP